MTRSAGVSPAPGCWGTENRVWPVASCGICYGLRHTSLARFCHAMPYRTIDADQPLLLRGRANHDGGGWCNRSTVVVERKPSFHPVLLGDTHQCSFSIALAEAREEKGNYLLPVCLPAIRITRPAVCILSSSHLVSSHVIRLSAQVRSRSFASHYCLTITIAVHLLRSPSLPLPLRVCLPVCASRYPRKATPLPRLPWSRKSSYIRLSAAPTPVRGSACPH